MRRLLYLALVLVFLAITGLAFVSAWSSGAYQARSRAMRIHQGMTPEQVQFILDRTPCFTYGGKIAKTMQSWEWEAWDFGGYHLAVYYDPDSSCVSGVFSWKDSGPSALDRVLNFLGYPNVVCFPK